MYLICHKSSQDDLIEGSFSQHLAKFGGHRHCRGVDIMILVCYVTLQDHVIKGSCDFMARNPSK